MTRAARTVGWTALACGLLVAGSALAWRQYHTKDTTQACGEHPEACGCGLRWYQTDISYLVDQAGLEHLDDKAVQAAVDAAFATWQGVSCSLCPSSHGPGCPPQSCSPQPLGLKLHSAGVGAPTPVGATCRKFDAEGKTCMDIVSNGNFITFLHDRDAWQAATHQSQFVFALTILTYNRQTGAIADADILLDDADFDFCISDCGNEANNLCNTLTHEAGHFLGLDHSSDPEATMYATAPAGETRKCSLYDDDRLGVCTAYRTACSTQGCPEKDSDSSFFGLCSAGRRGSPWGWLGLCALAVTIVRRRVVRG